MALGAAGLGLLGRRAADAHATDPSGVGVGASPALLQGARALTYTLNGAEVWVTDFGDARLQGGRARVELDRAWLGVANTDRPYRVLLTPAGPTPGLYVAQRDARGFTVEEQPGGSGAVAFDYQVVAKQRGSEEKRLESFTPPELPVPPPIPLPPPLPAPPDGGKPR